MEWLSHLLGPLHPPVTHFPIVCSILAVLAFGIGSFKKAGWLLRSAGALWLLSFISALASVLLGHLFAHHLGMTTDWALLPPEEAMKGHLRFHALIGSLGLVFSLVTLPAAWRLLRDDSVSLWFPLLAGLVVAVLFGVTGHEGGEMTYGEEELPSSVETPVTSVAESASVASGGLFELLGDYRKNLVKMNSKTWNSRTHGHRWVNTYVSKEAVAAYKNSDTIPEGAWVVKESFEDVNNQPSQTPGPLYVMRKGKLSDFPRTAGWQYALSWPNPVPGNPEKIQGPVTWLPGDPHLNSCVKCHSHFKTVDYVGGVPEEFANP